MRFLADVVALVGHVCVLLLALAVIAGAVLVLRDFFVVDEAGSDA